MIKNFYTLTKKSEPVHNPGFHLHGLELPNYSILIGPSGSGKSNVLLNFLSLANKTFTKIVICVKNADEPLYNLLKEKSKDIEFFEGGNIPDIEEFDGSVSSLIVFDDLVLEKDQRKIEEYFIRGRKKNITVFYLSQSYYKIPKTIRINARYIFIKKLSSTKDLKLILSEYNLNFNIKQILSLYEQSTRVFTDFLLIDTVNSIFRKNFN